MNSKKAWYSYISYLFFAAATAVALTEYCLLLWSGSYITNGGNVFTRWLISSQTIYNVMMKVFIFAVYVVLIIVFLIVTIWAQNAKKKHPVLSKTKNIWEFVILAAIILGAAAYKILVYGSNIPDVLYDMSYYNWAQVRTQSAIPEIQHGASMLYLYLLSFMMSFIGNKIMTVVILQIIIQLVTIPILYFAVKIWAGRVPAVISACVFSFFSIINEKLYEANPECLLFMLICVILLLCGLFCRSRHLRINAKGVVLSVILGISVGFVSYLDISGFIIFAFLLTLLMPRNEKKDKGSGLFYFLLILVITLASVVGFIFAKSFVFGGSFSDEYAQWVSFAKQSFVFKQYMYSADNKDISLIECFVLTFMAAEFIPSFWLHETDHETVFIIPMVIAWTPMMGFGIMSSNIFSIFVWSVMAGIGLQCMTVHVKKARERKHIVDRKSRKVVIGAEPAVEPETEAEDVSEEKESKEIEGHNHESDRENQVEYEPDSRLSAYADKDDDSPDNVAASDSDPKADQQPGKSEAPKAVSDIVDDLWKEIAGNESKQSDAAKTDESVSDINVQIPEIPSALELPKESGKSAAVEKTEVQKKPAAVKYIKNPLPQPVKHEKKDISFDQDDDLDSDFEIDIDNDDDFDRG